MSNENHLIGRKVHIKKNIDSFLAGEWGVIVHYDGDYYHVAPWNGGEESMIFSRDEFIVERMKEKGEK